MRQFAKSGFRIWNLSVEAKLVYTGFGLFSLLALASSVAFYEELVGTSRAGVTSYYAGQSDKAASGVAPSRAAEAGPALDLPAEAPAPRIVVAMSYHKLLETTHFHLFTVPVFLLIIAHLFMLTGLGQTTKVLFIAAGWLGSLAHLAAPWLIRYGGAGFAWSFPASGLVMTVALTFMTVYPLVAMWRPPPRPSGTAPEVGPAES